MPERKGASATLESGWRSGLGRAVVLKEREPVNRSPEVRVAKSSAGGAGESGKERTEMAVPGVSRATIAQLQNEAGACETVQQIIDVAVTAEALAVAALGRAIEIAQSGALAMNDEQIQVLQANRVAEQAHYQLLIGAGAQPLTTTFTIPDPMIVSDVPTFLTTLIGLEEAFIAAYMAAAQIFAIRGQSDLVRLAVQIGAVEADHRAHARFYAVEAGVIDGVPNNLAYEKALFSTVTEAAEALQALGWIGGDGPEISYPGPGEIINPGVIYLEP